MIPEFNAITSSGTQQKKKKNLSVPKLEGKIGCTGFTKRRCISLQLGTFLRDFQGQVSLYLTFALPADSRHYPHLRCHCNHMALHSTLERLSLTLTFHVFYARCSLFLTDDSKHQNHLPSF